MQELGIPIFMHPNGAENALRAGFWDGSRGSLTNTIGNPLETTIALSHLIIEGTLDRFPGVRICAAHAGGYLPSYLGRTNAACGPLRGGNCASTKPPSEYFKQQILVDTMVFSDEGLRHLVAEVGANQVVYGTDIGSRSLTGGWPDTLDIVLDSQHLSNADKEAILGGTRRAFCESDLDFQPSMTPARSLSRRRFHCKGAIGPWPVASSPTLVDCRAYRA